LDQTLFVPLDGDDQNEKFEFLSMIFGLVPKLSFAFIETSEVKLSKSFPEVKNNVKLWI
jgi:hypothetical protein